MGKLVFVILVVVCLYLFFKDDAPKPASHTPALSSESGTSESEPTKSYPYARTGERGSGHQAGYDWAEQNGITDESACEEAGDHSNSPSFAEGCAEYVESLK